MRKFKIWLVIALVFIAGFAGGVVTTRAVVRHTVQGILRNPNRVRELVEKRMTSRLKLDAAQRQKVDEILTRSQGQIKELRQEFAPRFRDILSSAKAEISVALRPEQQEKFQRMLEEDRALWPAGL